MRKRRFNQSDLAMFENNFENQLKKSNLSLNYRFSHIVRAVAEVTSDGMYVISGKVPASNYAQAEEIYERFLKQHPGLNIQILDMQGCVVKELIT